MGSLLQSMHSQSGFRCMICFELSVNGMMQNLQCKLKCFMVYSIVGLKLNLFDIGIKQNAF